jgi:hypothetical protein
MGAGRTSWSQTHLGIWRSGPRWTGEDARLSTEAFLFHSSSSLTQPFPSDEW